MSKKIKISANIDRLFAEMELPERIAAAADVGFQGVDIPLPYEFPAPELRDQAVFAGLPILRIDAPPPNYTGGPQGFAADPECVDRFRLDVRRVERQAEVFGAPMVHLRTGLETRFDLEVLVENLRYAAEQSPKRMFLIEVLNQRDYPDHGLAHVATAIRVLETVRRDNVKLLFSSWHASRQPEGLGATWAACAPHVGHVLIGGGYAAESDNRAQAMLELVRASDYAGWVCADYTPQNGTQRSLGWLTG